MNRSLIVITLTGSLLTACLPAFLRSAPATSAPLSKTDLEATAGVLIQQTLDTLPTATIAPSNTPVVKTATLTASPVPPSSTPSAESPTATLTAGATITGTPATSTPNTPAVPPAGTLPLTMTPSGTPGGAEGSIVTETLHPQHFGTLPPYLAFGKITLINKSKSQVYISLHCTTKEGYTTIIEYPVSGTVDVKAPLGKYTYVAWVGGKKIVGNFLLDNNSDLNIKIFKDHLEISKRK